MAKKPIIKHFKQKKGKRGTRVGVNKKSVLTMERIAYIVGKRLELCTRKDILQAVANNDVNIKAIESGAWKRWGVTASQIDNYIREADKAIREPITERIEELRAKHYRINERLMKKMYKDEDYKGVLAANTANSNLVGSNAPVKTELDLTANKIIVITPNE